MLVGPLGAAPQRDRTISAGVFAAAALYFGLLAPYGLNIGEEGGTVFLIYRTLSGQRPYIDFISGYTPAYFYWHAWVLRLFGTDLLSIRFCLALVNGASVLLLYTVARLVMPPRFAACAAFAYLALLPVVPSTACSFNVPYPSWYVLPMWLLSIHALRRWSVTGRGRWILAAGVLAGTSFSFKPNSGLFCLAADALCIAFVADPRRQLAAHGRGRKVFGWAAVMAAVLAGVLTVFRAHVRGREGLIFVAPLVVLIARELYGRPVEETADARPSCRFDTATGLLLAGFALVTLPWLLYFGWQLGWPRFVRDVLFVNTGYEQFFYLPYRALGRRDAVLIAGLAALAGAVAACRRRWIRPGTVAALVAGTAGSAGLWIALVAPMAEGFQRSVLLAVQDASFGAALAIHWMTLVAYGFRRRSDPARRDVVFVLANALCMYLAAYPRSDFFHLSLSAPLTWVLGAFLAFRLVQGWHRAAAESLARWGERLTVATVWGVLVVLALPQLGLCAQVVAYYTGRKDGALLELPLRRAPVLVVRGPAASVLDLVPVVAFLEQERQPGDAVFTFPNLDLIGFLAGLQTPARIGYFNPGWPDHAVEAEVVDALAERPPRFAVVANPASLYFADAPVYYLLIREFVTSHYRPWGRAGSYRVFLRRDAAASPFATPESSDATRDEGTSRADCDDPYVPRDPWRLRQCLARPGGSLTRIIQHVRDSESPDGAVILAESWASGLLPASGSARLALRVVGELGDARAAAHLLTAATPRDAQVDDARTTALFHIAVRGVIETFQFGQSDEGDGVSAVRLVHPRLYEWLASPDADVRLRFFAAWVFGYGATHGDGSDDPAGVVRALEGLLDSANAGLQLVAATALVRWGGTGDLLPHLLALADRSPAFAPSLMLVWSRAHPAAALPVLVRALEEGTPAQRETVAFLAGVLRWPPLLPALQQAVTAPQPRVRLASLWALGWSGDPAVLATVRAALADPDEDVRRFADVARRRLEKPGASG